MVGRVVEVGDYINTVAFKELDPVSPADGSEELLVFQGDEPFRGTGLSVTNVVIKSIVDNDLTVPNAVSNWNATEW